MRWRLKISKTDPSGEQGFEKTFLVDGSRDAIYAGFAISFMLHLRGYNDEWDILTTPKFLEPDTGKEVPLSSSRRMLAEKVREAGLSPQHVKGHSIRIVVATAYANSPEDRSIMAEFTRLWASGARWAYMHDYRRPLELSGLAVARETVVVLAVRPGLVSAYAEGKEPR